jgi:arginyl-tRNA synthetase
MTANLFDYFEQAPDGDGASARWAARAPRRPHANFDIRLTPRLPNWREDRQSLRTLKHLRREPWVKSVSEEGDGVYLCLDDGWIETIGAALEAGASTEAALADLARGRRYAVQFWDANATKALHIGHLRNLAIGNAVAAALTQAGAQVERRSLISDAGRSMGEAMAGVMNSGRHAHSWPDGDEKSDHFVGVCYADYVAANGALGGAEVEYPEDSLTRELALRDDAADELLRRVMSGELEALELWYKTRAWVIAGQRKTLARLGVAFDRVFFESDFLADAARLTADGLRDGRLRRREDGVVIYATGMEDFEEFPLVRADGVPTQHMRSLAYWMAAPELDGTTSMQVCGTEWVSHVTCRRKLMSELLPRVDGGETATPANGGGVLMHPTLDIFNGMVSRQKRALASSEGALLIDELIDLLDAQLDASYAGREVRRRHPCPERIAAEIALGFFVSHPVAPPIDFEPAQLLADSESFGWDVVRARAYHSDRASTGVRPEPGDTRLQGESSFRAEPGDMRVRPEPGRDARLQPASDDTRLRPEPGDTHLRRGSSLRPEPGDTRLQRGTSLRPEPGDTHLRRGSSLRPEPGDTRLQRECLPNQSPLRPASSFRQEPGDTRLRRASPVRPAEDPDFRFAVVQGELYRRYLRLAVQRYDVGPLVLYLKHLARWYMERPRAEHVERVVQTLLDRGVRGLGLEGTR